MVLTYCPICRRVQISAEQAREMASDFDAMEELEKEDLLEEISEAESEDEVLDISDSVKLQTRQRIAVPDDFNGETWVKMSDQEWGVIQTILNSPTLLYMVDNYADYPEKCPDCLAAEDIREKAEMN